MKFNIKEPYRTAIIISVATSVIIGAAYLAIPKEYKLKMKEFIKSKFKKKDERESKEPAKVG
jgi:hypothetical protein